MAQIGDDCYFFYFQTCVKGAACPFRHVEEARRSDVTCEDWRLGRCRAIPCYNRHMELQKNTPCYFETQPAGCTKPNCQFLHKFGPKSGVLATTAPGSQTVLQPPLATGPLPVSSHAPGPWTTTSAPGSVPLGGSMWPRPHIPPPHMFPGMAGPPRMSMPQYGPPGPPPIPRAVIGPGHMIEPVIINPNEESDQDSVKGSPMKQKTTTKSDNPLDYFLNAKPWVDPNPRQVVNRSPSPRRLSPYRRQGSSSPRRSESPEAFGRRRSMSSDKYDRRRSSSLERVRSSDWRDRRRFARRTSRSPPRRSPVREGKSGGILNRFRTETRGPKLEEVKVKGSKVISIKKTKTETEDLGVVEKEIQEKKGEEESSKLTSSKSVPVLEEEVKSLEDIYRERALMSLMEAKRKKILENKRKRWEKVQPAKTSESEKSDKSEGVSAVDEKGDKAGTEVDSSSDSPDDGGDGNTSEIELPDDIDIELGEGELESDHDQLEQGSEDNKVEHKSEDAKPSIKSRLGLKTVEQVSQSAVKDRLGNTPPRPRSVKDRLGMKTDSEKPLRSGVIRLNRASKADEVMSRIRINRDRRERESVLMVPQITIKNQYDIEERKAGIKQRLGLLDDDENSNDSKKGRKKKRSIDEELMKLLKEEEADIDEDDLDLLSKKEKKKLLKKLLVQQDREDEYEEITRKKKRRGFKKKKDRVDEDGDRESKRHVNVQERHSSRKEDEEYPEKEEEDLLSEEEEIELGETALQETSPDMAEKGDAVKMFKEDAIKPRQSEAEIQRLKEKEAQLREALEPKSLDDIRRERAQKRASGDGSMLISAGQNTRRIVMDEPEEEKPVDPPVRITFDGLSSGNQPRRKLIRLVENREQNENDQPAESKSFRAKRERQIYVPPTLKRQEAPEKKATDISSRLGGVPRGREIVDYGDMFPKSSGSPEKKTTVRLVGSASESDLTVRPPLRLQKGPPKVEVKDATVKTFAEIMAEKKRKRLLAQQGKSYTPVPEEPDSSSQSSIPEDRLSPLLSESQPNNSIETSDVFKSVEIKKSASDISIQQSEKPTRWKRRKLTNADTSGACASVQTQELSGEISNSQSTNQTMLKENKSKTENFDAEEEVILEDSSQSKVDLPAKVTESKSSSEKKKPSDSFMDFDDDLLDIGDDSDFEVEGAHQDPDELMREIDELLS